MEYNRVAILITENCNARCKMCCDSRGEVKGYTLTFEELDIVLKKIEECDSIKAIGITGGEPMLYPELIEYIFNYDYKRDMKFTIKTNGFWGKDIEKYKKFLYKYRTNISTISFSYDEFHKEFIELDNIKKIIDVCFEYKIDTEIVGCFLNKGLQPSDVLLELDRYMYYTNFLYQPVINTGSANRIDEDKFIKLINVDKHDVRCLVTGMQEYSLAINPELKVYPCCSQCVENTILEFGDLREEKLLDIIENIKHNKVMHTIFTKGFAPFIDILKKNDINYPHELSSHCEMCEFLFNDDWFIKILKLEKFYVD